MCAAGPARAAEGAARSDGHRAPFVEIDALIEYSHGAAEIRGMSKHDRRDTFKRISKLGMSGNEKTPLGNSTIQTSNLSVGSEAASGAQGAYRRAVFPERCFADVTVDDPGLTVAQFFLSQSPPSGY